MKKILIAAAALVAVGSPAFATSSASCRAIRGPGPSLDLVIGHLAGPVVAQARLTDGTGTVAASRSGEDPIVAQSWLDAHALHLDLVDATGQQYLAQLRSWRRSGRGDYVGSLRVRGRQYQVRCRIDA